MLQDTINKVKESAPMIAGAAAGMSYSLVNWHDVITSVVTCALVTPMAWLISFILRRLFDKK